MKGTCLGHMVLLLCLVEMIPIGPIVYLFYRFIDLVCESNKIKGMKVFCEPQSPGYTLVVELCLIMLEVHEGSPEICLIVLRLNISARR